MIDMTGRVVRELVDAVATWRVGLNDYIIAGSELDPEDVPKDGRAPKAITVHREHPIRRRRAPLANYVFTCTIYHPDPRIVSEVAGLVSDAFHDRGPRVVTAGGQRVGAYISADIGGTGAAIEPGTKWPYERVSIAVIAPTIAIS